MRKHIFFAIFVSFIPLWWFLIYKALGGWEAHKSAALELTCVIGCIASFVCAVAVWEKSSN